MNEYDLTLFIREEEGLYRKYQETHYQRGYDLASVKRLLTEAGLEFVAAYDGFTRDAPRADSERICVLAREHGKQARWEEPGYRAANSEMQNRKNQHAE